MKITYTAPNRAHHYPYAEALNRAGNLHAFVSGFSRLSPRSPIPSIGDKLKRHDFFQTLYVAGLMLGLPDIINSHVNKLSNYSLDKASYKWAKESDVFLYFRTQGYRTANLLKQRSLPTLCVLEEVNSHVDNHYYLMKEEHERLRSGIVDDVIPDHELRLLAYEQADFILCPSTFVRDSFIQKGFAPDKLIKVNFGFPNIKGFDFHNENNDSTFRVLYVGQLHYRKGLRYAIEAFRNLKHPKKEFIIVGPKTRVTGLENINIPPNVVFTGPLKDDSLEYQYKRASVFVLPTIEEGLALVQGEALVHGVPLITTTHSGGDDLIKDGVEGYIVEPLNSDVILEKLQILADNPLLLKSMAYEAHKTAQNIGSWDVAAKNLVFQLSEKMKR
ncbi:glycosyltransferase family 4 protein [Spirosoma fluminis]